MEQKWMVIDFDDKLLILLMSQVSTTMLMEWKKNVEEQAIVLLIIHIHSSTVYSKLFNFSQTL